MSRLDNVILVGMSGAGKSTLGVILAKRLGYEFMDTDLLIQKKYKMLLQEIIDTLGREEFANREETVITELQCHRTVISTGGSVIYFDKAMKNLKKQGIVVYLAVPFEEIIRRIGSAENRGILIPEGFTLEDVWKQRDPLYRKYADIVLDIQKEETETTVKRLKEAIEERVILDKE